MSVTATSIIADAAEILLDPDYDRWDADFHLESVNEAERQAVIFKPDIYVLTSAFVLVQGTRQSLPDAAVQLNEITRNMGADGETPGDAITIVDRKDMDAFRPDWHSSTYENVTVKHFMFDERDPRKFWVYPPQTSAPKYVEAIYGAYPTPLTAVGNNIHLADIYRDTIKHYVIGRAHSLDAANSQFSAQRSLQAWNLFVTALDRKDLVERAYSPKIWKAKDGNSN